MNIARRIAVILIVCTVSAITAVSLGPDGASRCAVHCGVEG